MDWDYGDYYGDLVDSGVTATDAASQVDLLMVEDMLERRLGRRPTESELRAALDRI